ncbi:MAG: cytochrome c biogenesis protein CcdA, partial [Rhodobacteraceae bacterium]|nr:cytochrome c biogenesis protein CcdA [Paracoccaceae bacterium]
MFGIDLWDASLVPALVVAGLGGILSFLSPCVLPIVPHYHAYLAGISFEELSGEDVKAETAR